MNVYNLPEKLTIDLGVDCVLDGDLVRFSHNGYTCVAEEKPHRGISVVLRDRKTYAYINTVHNVTYDHLIWLLEDTGATRQVLANGRSIYYS